MKDLRSSPRMTDVRCVITWNEFRASRPDLAEAGTRLKYRFGVGLAFLATVRRDGGPRVHPMCPVITREGLFASIVPSPKRADLIRDSRYAMHSFPAESNEDAFYLTGRARPVDDPQTLAELADQFLHERDLDGRPPAFDEWKLFSFGIESCLLTETTGHGDPHPRHTAWHASAGTGSPLR